MALLSKRGIRAGLRERVTLKERPKGGEREGHHMANWVRNIPGRGNKHKGPKAEMLVVCEAWQGPGS